MQIKQIIWITITSKLAYINKMMSKTMSMVQSQNRMELHLTRETMTSL